MKHTSYISDSDKRKSGFFLLFTVEIIGIIIGSYIAVSDIDTETIRSILCPTIDGATLIDIFKNTLVPSLIFIVSAFLCGVFAFGQPLGIALIIAEGAEIGLSVAFLYAEKGISALPAVLVLYIPKAVAFSFVAVLAVREVLRNSALIMGFVISAEHNSEKISLKLYCTKFIVLTIIIFIISIADSLMNYVFSGLL